MHVGILCTYGSPVIDVEFCNFFGTEKVNESIDEINV